jgi:ribosomal protein L27
MTPCIYCKRRKTHTHRGRCTCCGGDKSLYEFMFILSDEDKKELIALLEVKV